MVFHHHPFSEVLPTHGRQGIRLHHPRNRRSAAEPSVKPAGAESCTQPIRFPTSYTSGLYPRNSQSMTDLMPSSDQITLDGWKSPWQKTIGNAPSRSANCFLFDEIEGLSEPFAHFRVVPLHCVGHFIYEAGHRKGRCLVEERDVPGLMQIRQEVGTRPSPPPVEGVGRSRRRSALYIRPDLPVLVPRCTRIRFSALGRYGFTASSPLSLR